MAAARSHRKNTSRLSRPKKKPAKARSKRREGPTLSRPDPERESGGQADATAVAEATTFADRQPSWHDRALRAAIAFGFIMQAAEDEAAVDHAIKLLDLIDQNTSAHEREREGEIKRLRGEANIPSHLDFREGVVFIAGTQRPDRAEDNFIEYLLCWNLLVCPYDDMRAEVLSFPARDSNEATGSYLERKKHEGFSKAELSNLRTTFRFWVVLRPGVKRKLRRNMQMASEATPTQGGEGSSSEPPEKN